MQRAAQTLPFSDQSDEEVLATLREHRIGLTVVEARRVTELLGRDPSLTETVIWGIQGSEHCSYKSSKRFLKRFLTEGRHVILGPSEDSGIMAMTDAPAGKRWGVVVTHESHNHPSQIVPFEGAATGVGGTVRDVLCMGARVIGCMDMLRLGDLKSEETRTVAAEVIRGIGGYGNPIGVPNLGGDTVFDASYNGNCLVNAVSIGIVREDEIVHSFVPDEAGKVGYDILVVGKPTDYSGFGGASFASASMETGEKERNSGAVQEPNPFLERHLLASFYALFDWLAAEGRLGKIGCKDLGAGGVVCASVEQVADKGFGAEIELAHVHVSIPDLPPEVIACAETQERLCITCHPDLTDRILRHFNETWDLPSVAENARASAIGKVTEGGIYRLTYRGETVCEAPAKCITCGLEYERPTTPVTFAGREPRITCDGERISVEGRNFSIAEIFSAMISHPNHASKEYATVHFDKNVIGNTLIEPGEADAGVIAPLQDIQSYVLEGSHPGWEVSGDEEYRGVAVAADGVGRYGRISPYWQGANAALEAMRNVVAVGATPQALTDCLNYGNPEIPEQLWALEEGVRGINDTSRNIAFRGEPVPIISGNVSLYNGRPDGSAIDPTAIVCCIGVIGDARKAVTMQLKQTGSALVYIGALRDECGGSAYYQILEERSGAPRNALLGANVPKPDFAAEATRMGTVLDAIESGAVLACHDISVGGLLLALFEMTLPQRETGGDIGIAMDLGAMRTTLRPDVILFSESGGFLLEVPAESAQSIAGGVVIGHTTAEPSIVVHDRGSPLFNTDIRNLTMEWKFGLSRAM